MARLRSMAGSLPHIETAGEAPAVPGQDSLAQVTALHILTVTPADLEESWPFFQRRDLHKLSAVDATSFVLMSHEKIRTAFTFDHHFAKAGFRLVG
jgi:predicted nucleic acid-binding protein